MKNFSFILLKGSDAQAQCYSVSYRSLYFLALTLILLLTGLAVFFYQQHSLILKQEAMLSEDSEYQKSLQEKIARLQSKESTIFNLKESLEQSKELAEKRLEKLQAHAGAYKQSLESLKQLHQETCGTLKRECPELDTAKLSSPDDAILWMSGARQDFDEFQVLVEKFARRQFAAEEQELTIKQLQQRIAKTDRKIAASLELLKKKEQAIMALAKKIKQATGITVPVQDYFLTSRSRGGRGGPSSDPKDQYQNIDYMDTDNFHRYLEQTEKYYNVVSESFESAFSSVEEQSELWANTPTFIPVANPRISDHYGKRISPFNKRWEFHAGTDFPKKTGTKIYVAANGRVTFAGVKGGYGKFIQIHHGQGLSYDKKRKVNYTTRYGHLHQILVKQGEKVKRGQVIGTVGNTGRSTGPHLHYEIFINRKHINPMTLVRSFAVKDPLR